MKHYYKNALKTRQAELKIIKEWLQSGTMFSKQVKMNMEFMVDRFGANLGEMEDILLNTWTGILTRKEGRKKVENFPFIGLQAEFQKVLKKLGKL